MTLLWPEDWGTGKTSVLREYNCTRSRPICSVMVDVADLGLQGAITRPSNSCLFGNQNIFSHPNLLLKHSRRGKKDIWSKMTSPPPPSPPCVIGSLLCDPHHPPRRKRQWDRTGWQLGEIRHMMAHRGAKNPHWTDPEPALLAGVHHFRAPGLFIESLRGKHVSGRWSVACVFSAGIRPLGCSEIAKL